MNRIVYLGFRCSYIIYAFVSYSHWFSFRISVGAAAIAGICFITSFSLPLSLIFPCAFSRCWSQFFWYLRRLSKQRSQKKKIGVQHNTIEKWSKWKWFAFFRECKTIWKNFSSTNFCMGMCLHQIDLHTRLNRTKLWNKANQRQAREKKWNKRKEIGFHANCFLFSVVRLPLHSSTMFLCITLSLFSAAAAAAAWIQVYTKVTRKACTIFM